MTQPEQQSPTHRAIVFLLILVVACALALASVFLKIDFLAIAFVGPVMLLFAASGLEESVPLFIGITLIYIPLLLIPTGIRYIIGKWTRPLIVLQILFLLPNALICIFVILISGTQM